LDRAPEAGLLGPPKLGLGFHPGLLGGLEPDGRGPEPAAARGVNEPSPASRRKGRLAGPEDFDSNGRLGAAPKERPPGFRPADADLSPGLLLGRAPPGRGIPLLVVKGRARPPSLRKGLDALGRSEAGRSGRE